MQPLHEFANDDHVDIIDEGMFLTPKKGEKVIFARRGERTPDMTPFRLLHIRAAKIRADSAQAAPPEPKRPKYWHS